MIFVKSDLFAPLSRPFFSGALCLNKEQVQSLFFLAVRDFLVQVVNRNTQKDLKHHVAIEQVEALQRRYLVYLINFFAIRQQGYSSSC